MLSRLSAQMASPVRGGGADQNDVAAFVKGIRREATELLVSSLGEERLAELRRAGTAMDATQAYTFARASIDEYLLQPDVAGAPYSALGTQAK